MSIFEVLHTVDRYSQFTGALTHRMAHNQQPILSPTINFATLYLLSTGESANIRLIDEQWDNIKRFLVSVKLNHALPSTLLRRLTSYSGHYPLYQALRELGKVVRTIFILQYMDEEDTRRRVNHAQTKVENMHQLASELNLGKMV